MATDKNTAAAETNAPADYAAQDAAAQAEQIKLEVTVRPIEPKGKLIGFASVNFGGVITVHDFRVFNGENGLFVGPPSVKDAMARSGYRDTARLIGDDIKNQLNLAAREAYVAEVQKLQARAAAVAAPEMPRIREQMEKAGQEAAKDSAARQTASVRPESEKGKAARDDR